MRLSNCPSLSELEMILKIEETHMQMPKFQIQTFVTVWMFIGLGKKWDNLI